MSASYIYFLKPVDLTGPIKIGCSAVPQGRLEIFMAWSPFPLEIIGKVPGNLKDEGFFHRCFADCHSHGEWFRATPRLLEAITALIAAGNIDALRSTFTEVGSIRKKRRPATAEEILRRSYTAKVMWAEKRLRKLGEDTLWHAPDDVTRIIARWSGPNFVIPTEIEMGRLNEYLRKPAEHSVIPSWRRPKVAA